MTQINDDLKRIFKKAPKWAMYVWIDANIVGGVEPIFTEKEPRYSSRRYVLEECGRSKVGDMFWFSIDEHGNRPLHHGVVFERPASVSMDALRRLMRYRKNRKWAVIAKGNSRLASQLKTGF